MSKPETTKTIINGCWRPLSELPLDGKPLINTVWLWPWFLRCHPWHFYIKERGSRHNFISIHFWRINIYLWERKWKVKLWAM